jgi:capsular exopolysaccharide synthesis family protein
METESVTPREYFGVLRRHKLVVIGITALVVLGAYLHARNEKPLYQASVRVAVNQQPQLPGTAPGAGNNSQTQQRFASTQAQLARSLDAAEAALAAAHLKDRTPLQFLDQSDVTADPASDVLTFIARDSNPDQAARLANAYAKGFDRYQAKVSLKAPLERRAQLQREIESLDKRIVAANGQHVAPLFNRSALAANELQNINTYIAFANSGAVVITNASDGATKLQPKMARDLAIATVLGLILGAIAAFVLEAFRGRVSSAHEIANALRLPVLAQLPRPSRRLERDDRIVLLHDPDKPEGEPYRILAARLALLNGDNRRRVLITSATGEEGKSTTVANLAVAFAQAGSRVALVDLDINKPGLFRYFDGARAPGAAEVARGDANLHEALQRFNVSAADGDHGDGAAEQLLLLTLGNLTDDPARFLGSPELNQILTILSETCDVVFIDTAPLLLVSHATILAPKVDALITIARSDTLSRAMLKRLQDALDGLPVYKAGMVLTNAESTLDYRYGNPPTAGSSSPAKTRT